MSSFARLLLPLCLLLSSVSALANEEARQAFAEGNELYTVGKFAEAAAAFQRAYDADPQPAFLFNLGQAHMGAEEYKRALFFYEGFLREMPDAPNRELVEQRMAEARTRRAAQREREEAEARAQREREETARKLALERERRAQLDAQREATAEERKRAEAEGARAEEERRRIEAEVALQEATPIVEREWFWPTVGGSLAAVGAAALVGTGIGFGVWALSLPPASTLPDQDLR